MGYFVDDYMWPTPADVLWKIPLGEWQLTDCD